jgi:hypothetical protein
MVNSINIFGYLSDKMSTQNTKNDKSGQDQSGQDQSGQDQSGQAQSGQAQSGQDQSGQAQSGQAQSGQAQSGQAQSGQIKSLLDFLNLIKNNIDSDLEAGKKRASAIAVINFLNSFDEKSSSDDQKLEDEEMQLIQLHKKISFLKRIQFQVVKFVEKLSTSADLNQDEFNLYRILVLYYSLDYKSSDLVQQINRYLMRIRGELSELFLLNQSTINCHNNVVSNYNRMSVQQRTITRAHTWRTAPSNKYKHGREMTDPAVLRPRTQEEQDEESRQKAQSIEGIKKINSEIEERLEIFQCLTNEFNQHSIRFSEISEEFKSLAENLPFFDFMMRLFQGQICEDTFSQVSKRFGIFSSSLQTTIDNFWQFMKEIDKFKWEKEEENRLLGQEMNHFNDLYQENLEKWKQKDIQAAIRRMEEERKQQELEEQNGSFGDSDGYSD